TENIPIIFKKAFWIASTGRPGPVEIDIPKDILKLKNVYIWPKKINIRSYNLTTEGNYKQIKKALEKLLTAKKPVIYAGGGVISSESSQELLNLAENLKFPVTTSLMGLGSFPGNHPQCLSMLGMHGTYEANMTMHHADLIFAIGVRFDDRTTNNLKKYCPNAVILHIDIDPTSISKTIAADIPI
ncbi:MAG: acetolactate synthase 3 large subunit, partial [Buchnera aphidicola]|nr:acetolactate synthase 3 large subunit [Buchnera aphidicola]